ncbi:hypothetical protein B0H14DRAFT_2565360 [Mycena olivaceomarginata]|nr:hypothetical protein B0H14DRAFT_2565360 [Mycena olivaceomarginata]
MTKVLPPALSSNFASSLHLWSWQSKLGGSTRGRQGCGAGGKAAVLAAVQVAPLYYLAGLAGQTTNGMRHGRLSLWCWLGAGVLETVDRDAGILLPQVDLGTSSQIRGNIRGVRRALLLVDRWELVGGLNRSHISPSQSAPEKSKVRYREGVAYLLIDGPKGCFGRQLSAGRRNQPRKLRWKALPEQESWNVQLKASKGSGDVNYCAVLHDHEEIRVFNEGNTGSVSVVVIPAHECRRFVNSELCSILGMTRETRRESPIIELSDLAEF